MDHSILLKHYCRHGSRKVAPGLLINSTRLDVPEFDRSLTITLLAHVCDNLDHAQAREPLDLEEIDRLHTLIQELRFHLWPQDADTNAYTVWACERLQTLPITQRPGKNLFRNLLYKLSDYQKEHLTGQALSKIQELIQAQPSCQYDLKPWCS
jgi:hypothetical protein